ncbi:MAG: hypothetical protein HOQ24_10675 [Mycobacteriaceae bacterium]|nr:hypothetical protein [Mycobacteriaceae bacterium]
MTEDTNSRASLREQQVAMSLLAHAARDDAAAVALSLQAIGDAGEKLELTQVIAALLVEFQKGIDEEYCEQLADWFSGQARELALAAD